MRTKNVAWVLEHTLASLSSQTMQDFELWIIDSGSTDRTLEIARRHEHEFIHIEPSEYFPGRVLNQAAARARGELLVLWNSDTVALREDALEKLVDAFDAPDVEAAYARQAPRPEAEHWVKRDYAASFPAEGAAAPWMSLSFPLAAVRASSWRVQKFYTDAWGSEDTQWGVAAEQRGARVVYVPEALVMHSHNYTLAQGWGRRFIEGEADAFIYPERELSWSRLGFRASIATLSDAKASALGGRFGELCRGIPRRFVDQLAYGRGARHGARRRRSGDRDASYGAAQVLKRHESVRSERDGAGQ